MCFFSSPSVPEVQEVEEPEEDPTEVDEAVKTARRDEVSRIRAMAGAGSTVRTTPLGTTDDASTIRKKLLGA